MNEETYTMKMIEKYLIKTGLEDIRIVTGDDPPDYDVYIGKEKYALEITNAETVNSSNQKRREFSEPLFQLSATANKSNKLTQIVGGDKILLLYIDSKIQDFNKFKKILLNPKQQDLQDYIEALSTFPEVKVKVCNKFVDKKRIQFIIGDKDDELNIQKQILRIVENIFVEKKKKMDRRGISDTRWLGIKINHFFDGEEYWKQAVETLETNYGFSRVFFVSQAENIYDYKL